MEPAGEQKGNTIMALKLLARLWPAKLAQPSTQSGPFDLIDLDADPFVPHESWKVEEHRKGGQFRWESTKVRLHWSRNQTSMSSIEGNELRVEIRGQSVYNANLLDYLLKNNHLIPEECEDKRVFFWGTIYRNSDVRLCVRCLCSDGDRWYSFYRSLNAPWDDDHPAAMPCW